MAAASLRFHLVDHRPARAFPRRRIRRQDAGRPLLRARCHEVADRDTIDRWRLGGIPPLRGIGRREGRPLRRRAADLFKRRDRRRLVHGRERPRLCNSGPDHYARTVDPLRVVHVQERRFQKQWTSARDGLHAVDGRKLPNTLKTLLVGKPRDPMDPRIFHHVSLIAFLAWVGLGADGLSSSAYGPEAIFKALGSHTYLAVFLTLAVAGTVFIISFAYSLLIEHFPGGGGGYLVATKLLGPRLGVVSGCALIVDYVLTITVSVATGCDAVFSFLPPSMAHVKLEMEVFVLLFLVVLNLRGVKESVTFLLPIFLLFVAAQTGFIDGPRILANLAVDSWVPHRFEQLSVRVVTKNGISMREACA